MPSSRNDSRKALLNALRDPHRAVLRGKVLAEHDELVAAKARDCELLVAEASEGVAGAEGCLQALRDRFQERVAGAVPERVVHVLEPVEIEEQQRGQRAVTLGARQRQLETVAEQEPVCQPGEGVMRRLVSYLLLRVDSLDHASELPTDLGHHFEQGVVRHDGGRAEELENGVDCAVRVDRERERAPNSKLLSHEARIARHIRDPGRAARGEDATGKPDALRERHLLGRAAKGRELSRLPRVPVRGRQEIPAGRVEQIRVADGPGGVDADGIDGTLERVLQGQALVRGQHDRFEKHKLLLLVVQRSGGALRDLLHLAAREPLPAQPSLERVQPGLGRRSAHHERARRRHANAISSRHWSSPRFMQRGCSIVSCSP